MRCKNAQESNTHINANRSIKKRCITQYKHQQSYELLIQRCLFHNLTNS